ncbi:hypothetical protein [Mycolicibacterium lutetiense]
MTHIVITGLDLTQHVATTTVLAAGTTWDDVMFNVFDKYKIWAAIVSFMLIAGAGIGMLARARMVGIMLLIVSVFVAAFFLTADRWINISVNTEKELHQPSKGNPFNRG